MKLFSGKRYSAVCSSAEPWRRRGFERAAGFTWEKTARAHDAAYEEVHAMMSR